MCRSVPRFSPKTGSRQSRFLTRWQGTPTPLRLRPLVYVGLFHDEDRPFRLRSYRSIEPSTGRAVKKDGYPFARKLCSMYGTNRGEVESGLGRHGNPGHLSPLDLGGGGRVTTRANGETLPLPTLYAGPPTEPNSEVECRVGVGPLGLGVEQMSGTYP